MNAISKNRKSKITNLMSRSRGQPPIECGKYIIFDYWHGDNHWIIERCKWLVENLPDNNYVINNDGFHFSNINDYTLFKIRFP